MSDKRASHAIAAAAERRRYLTRAGIVSITTAEAIERRLKLLAGFTHLKIPDDVLAIAKLRVTQPDWSLSMLAQHAGMTKEALAGRLARFVHKVDGECVRMLDGSPQGAAGVCDLNPLSPSDSEKGGLDE